MARKKVNLAWIANDATRRATLKKRRKGLLKKVSELSTLCDVRACAVVYSPHEPHPEVWPSEAETKRILSGFRSMPEMEQCKKMMNQEGFIGLRVSKLNEQVRKLQRENHELEMNLLLLDALAGGGTLHDVGFEDATSLKNLIDVKARAVNDRIETLSRPAAAVAAAEGAMVVSEKSPMMESMEQQIWFGSHVAAAGPVANDQQHMMFGGMNHFGGGGGMEDFMPYVEAENHWTDFSF